ncbi:MAG: sulfatase [Bacteroidota bacterium]
MLLRKQNRQRLQLVPMFGYMILWALSVACSSDPRPPNILFVMTDDHAYHQMSLAGNPLIQTPNLDRLAEEGVWFNNSFCTNSLCAPARAAILTGCLSNINGILGNSESKERIERLDPDLPTFPRMLQRAGYQTALIGKWHLPHEPRGFDYSCILPGQGLYVDPDLIENGIRKKFQGYVTDIITDLALAYLKKRKPEKPFCLLYQHKGPHRPFSPAPRHRNLYEDIDFPHPETFHDDYSSRQIAAKALDMRFEQSLARDYEELPTGLSEADKKEWIYQRFVKDHYRALQSIDEGIGRLLAYLDEQGLSDQTLVIYTTDNGFYLGEHGWYDKRFMYEPSLRIPLLMRYPNAIESGQIDEHMVMNIDLAPTILDYAGITVPQQMQGESLKPLLAGKIDSWRETIYYSYYENSWTLRNFTQADLSDSTFQFFTAHRIGPHRGIRSDRHKLIEYYSTEDYWEFFDLVRDPHELNNLYADPKYKEVIVDMTARLRELQRQYKDEDSWESLVRPNYQE